MSALGRWALFSLVLVALCGAAWLEGKPVLDQMELGSKADPAALPNCSQVVGLHLPAQEIAIVGVAADRRFVVVPPREARNLCGRRWDWIGAVGRKH